MEVVFKNVTYSYKNKRMLDKINLTIESNKITGITGENKSILCELIDDIKQFQHGKILLDDISYTKENLKIIRNKVAMIKQNPIDQFFTNNPKEEIMFLISRLSYQPKDINKKIYQALEMVGLSIDILNKDIDELTIGEKKLFQIAISLIYNPDVIIFDEAFVLLDRTNRNKIIKLIKALKNKYNKTIIISSNDINLLYEITDNIVILKKNKVLLEGNTLSIYQDVNTLKEKNVDIPDLVRFTMLARAKKIKLSYHRDILDLIKDVYKHV